jgi:hypothetical protein
MSEVPLYPSFDSAGLGAGKSNPLLKSASLKVNPFLSQHLSLPAVWLSILSQYRCSQLCAQIDVSCSQLCA